MRPAAGRGRGRRRRAPSRAPSRASPRGPRRAAALVVLAAAASTACFDPGEPTPGDALVTWAAYPETVRTGRTFPLEVAGPLATNTCGRFDTVFLEMSDSAVSLSARRQVYTEAWCTDDRMSFYEVRAVEGPPPGRYPVRTREGRTLGAVVATDSGDVTRMRAIGEGTVRRAGGCLFFGPGWAHNQRPFPLEDPPGVLQRVAGTDTVVVVAGVLRGYEQCGGYGTRPAIRVDSARVTDRTGGDWYPGRPE